MYGWHLWGWGANHGGNWNQIDWKIAVKLLNLLLIYFYNIPVSKLFFPSGKQLEQCILAYKSEQPTAHCIAIFHKYCCYIKHGGIITNLTMKSLGYVTDMSKYHKVYGAWIWLYYILCLKKYGTFSCLFWSPAGLWWAMRLSYHYCIVFQALGLRHWVSEVVTSGDVSLSNIVMFHGCESFETCQILLWVT